MKFNDLFEFVVIVNEVYDTKIEPESWVIKDGIKVGHLKIDDENYYLNLEPKVFENDGVKISFINISFDKFVDGKKSQALTYDNRSGSKVIGAIYNAAKSEVEKYETDAVVFVALDNVEKRMRIYNSLLRKFHGDFLSHKENIKIPGGLMTIVFSKNFPKEQIVKFEEFLKQQTK